MKFGWFLSYCNLYNLIKFGLMSSSIFLCWCFLFLLVSALSSILERNWFFFFFWKFVRNLDTIVLTPWKFNFIFFINLLNILSRREKKRHKSTMKWYSGMICWSTYNTILSPHLVVCCHLRLLPWIFLFEHFVKQV